jgi:hypothetical protein
LGRLENSHQNFGNLQRLFAECGLEGLHNRGIKNGSGAPQDGVAPLDGRYSLAVRSIADRGVIGIGDGDDSSLNRYFFALRCVESRPSYLRRAGIALLRI